jgi:hypothetical protein
MAPLVLSNSSDTGDLWFSRDVVTSVINSVASYTASSTELLLVLNNTASDTAFYPGSSTVGIARTNQRIEDYSGRKANGTDGEYPGLEVIIKAE